VPRRRTRPTKAVIYRSQTAQGFRVVLRWDGLIAERFFPTEAEADAWACDEAGQTAQREFLLDQLRNKLVVKHGRRASS